MSTKQASKIEASSRTLRQQQASSRSSNKATSRKNSFSNAQTGPTALKGKKSSSSSLPKKLIKFSDQKKQSKSSLRHKSKSPREPKISEILYVPKQDPEDSGQPSPPPLVGPSKVSFDGPQSFIDKQTNLEIHTSNSAAPASPPTASVMADIPEVAILAINPEPVSSEVTSNRTPKSRPANVKQLSIPVKAEEQKIEMAEVKLIPATQKASEDGIEAGKVHFSPESHQITFRSNDHVQSAEGQRDRSADATVQDQAADAVSSLTREDNRDLQSECALPSRGPNIIEEEKRQMRSRLESIESARTNRKAKLKKKKVVKKKKQKQQKPASGQSAVRSGPRRARSESSASFFINQHDQVLW